MENKVAIVTGASSGIGKALVYELAKYGAKIVMAARNENELTNIHNDLSSKGVASCFIKCDVTNENDCKQLIEKAYSEYGKIDILINNAGISMRALFDDLDTSVLKQVMDVNFWGTVYCTKYALPYIQESHGSIVGVISIAGYLGLPGRTGYSASKFAVRGFLDTIRVENLKKNVHVMVAAPGFTASNIRKVALSSDGSAQGESPRNESKMMSSEECARIIIEGVKKRKREIIMTLVEGKIAVFLSKWWPSLLDRLNYNHMAKEPNSPLK